MKRVCFITRSTAEELESVGIKPPSDIEIVSGADVEKAQVLVCAHGWGMLADNICTHCVGCGRKIQHRPHAPRHALKACYLCVLDGRMEKFFT